MNENVQAGTNITYIRNKGRIMRDMTNIFSSLAPAVSPSLKRMLDPVVEDHAPHDEEVVGRINRSNSLPSDLNKKGRKKVRHCDKEDETLDLNGVLRRGKGDDIRLLIKRIKTAEKNSPVGLSGQTFHIYGGPEGVGAFGEWLRELGFEEFFIDDDMHFSIDMKKLKALRALLFVGKCRTESRPTPRHPNPAAPASRPTPLDINATQSYAQEDPYRAHTPSHFLSEMMADMTFRGETPRGVSRNNDTPGAVSDPFVSRVDSEDRPPAPALPTFWARFQERDESNDVEVHSHFIARTESSASGERCPSESSHGYGATQSQPQLDSPPSSLSTSASIPAEALAVDHGSAFATRGEASASISSYENRRLKSDRRSASEPVAYHRYATASPVRHCSLSQTHTGAFATPIKFNFHLSQGASTTLVAKFHRFMDTKMSSAKQSGKQSLGNCDNLPTLSIFSAEKADDGMLMDLDRKQFASCPAPGTAASEECLSAARRTLQARMSRPATASPILLQSEEKMPMILESMDESLKKKRLSNSKRVRMTGNRRGRRSSLFSLKKSQRLTEKAPLSPVSRGGRLSPVLTVDNFFPIVVGGVYQQSFEMNRPVVFETCPTFPRVLAIEMPNSMSSQAALQASILRLRKWYLSTVRSPSYSVYESEGDQLDVLILSPDGDVGQRHISLGSDWVVVPAHPGGLLIVSTKYFYPNDSRRMCFFVGDHFLRKELMCDVEQTDCISDEAVDNDTSIAMGLDLDASQCTEATENDDMDCMQLFSALETSGVSESSNNSEGHYRADTHLSHQHLVNWMGSGCAENSPAACAFFQPMLSPPFLSAIASHGAGKMSSSNVWPSESSSGLTPQGFLFFTGLLADTDRLCTDSPFSSCTKSYLKNSGDILELVLPFLEDNSTPKCVPGCRVRRTRSATSASPVVEEPTGFSAVQLVCRQWAVNWVRYTSSHWSPERWNVSSSVQMVRHYEKWVSFVKGYSAGTEVGSGGAKTVYRLQRQRRGGLIQRPSTQADALAVMDIKNVLETSVQQELVVSVACSALVKTNICPNIVQIHSTFQTPYPPPPMWKTVSNVSSIPNERTMKKGHYQYINMEFCSGGDIEQHIRKLKSKGLPPADIRSMFFQMCFSLYSCRDQVTLRHFDIKLLNFLLADSSVLVDSNNRRPLECDRVDYRVGFGENVFVLPLSLAAMSPGVVKLADFGTSLIGEDDSRCSVTTQQFTTLENTAPEFLFLGSAATSSSFAADTFGLGLSFLHMVTGYAPYEELLEQVRCPPALQEALMNIWTVDSRSSPYFVINEVLKSLDAPVDMGDSGDADTSVLTVLYDTLYRYVVLIGLPSADMFATTTGASNNVSQRNPVVAALLNTLDQGMNENAHDAVRAATMQFMKDSSAWNIFRGNHAIFKSARKKLHEISSDAEQWLRRMLCFDPLHRCLVVELLTSSMFEPLVEKKTARNTRDTVKRHQTLKVHTASYMYYFRPEADGGDRVLSML